MTSSSVDCGQVKDSLKRWSADFDAKFASVLIPAGDAPAELVEAMRYAALAGGKRLRPYFVTRCCVLSGGCPEAAFHAAVAVECVHTFSLVHDDLPSMDDDDLRRGQPTVHRKFGEAMAVLAGDALLTLAFELVVRDLPDAAWASDMVGELARGVGWSGMIGGQVIDILGEDKASSVDLVRSIHAMKTAALFETSCRLGALAGGADASVLSALSRYGRCLGSSFQAADDILDVTATASQMGKKVGKDATAGKQSLPRAVGIEESRKVARRLADEAVCALDLFGREADDLRALAKFVVQRQH